MRDTPDPIAAACGNYAEHYINNPSIRKAIAASSEMETMLRQMFGSCISGDNFPGSRPRSPPTRGPAPGMIIEATNSYINRPGGYVSSFGHTHSDVRSNAIDLEHDDEMSAITALTLEEMEKINLRKKGISKLADELINTAKHQRHMQEAQLVNGANFADSNAIPYEPSSTFVPNFDAFNESLQRESWIEQENIHSSMVTPRKSDAVGHEHSFSHSSSGSWRSDSRNKSMHSQMRVVTPPKSPERYANLDITSSKSTSSRSRILVDSNFLNHSYDQEMKSPDKMYVKSRLNNLPHLVNNPQVSITRKYSSSSVNSKNSKRSERTRLFTQNTKRSNSKTASFEVESYFDGRSNYKVHTMQMYDGSFQEFTDNDKFGEI